MIEGGYDELMYINQIMLGWVLKFEEDICILFWIIGMKCFVDLDLNSEVVKYILDLMVENNIVYDLIMVIYEYVMIGCNGIINKVVVNYIDYMLVSEQCLVKFVMFNVVDDVEDQVYFIVYQKILDMLLFMYKCGILLVFGIDMGGVFYFYWELVLFEKIGMIFVEVFKCGSYDMVEYFGYIECGLVLVGKEVDFFLVYGDLIVDLVVLKFMVMVVI